MRKKKPGFQPQPPVMWIDQWNCINTMSHKRAGEVLKEFYDAWMKLNLLFKDINV